MEKTSSHEMPIPPEALFGDKVRLVFKEISPGDPSKGYVPFYHFRIHNDTMTDIGHINFRIGQTNHIVYCAGHIGYEIHQEFRGKALSYHACLTLAPFVRQVYQSVLLTTSPDNLASIRTIEKLGGRFMDDHRIDEDECAYKNGERIRRRYRWFP